MTIIELLDKFEACYGASYTDEQRAAFLAKLDVFSDADLPRIYSGILEVCKKLPTVADIFSFAGGWITQPRETKVHTWIPTTCELCSGEGRIVTVWQRYFDRGRHRDCERLQHVMPYSSVEAVSYKPGDGEYVRFARCCCPAGDAATVPAGWPRWSHDVPQWRFV